MTVDLDGHEAASVLRDAALLGIDPSRVVAVRALPGGRGARTWRLSVDEGRGRSTVVLHRRPGAAAAQVEAEAAAIRAAAAVDAGPELVAVRSDRGLLLTRWLPGRVPSGAALVASHLDAAVHALARLHTGAPDRPLLPLAVPSPDPAEDAGLADVSAAAAAAGEPTLPLLHGDPVAGNLVVSRAGARWLDLEFAAAGPAAADLGGLAAALLLPDAAVPGLVDRYRRSGGSVGGPDVVVGWSHLSRWSWSRWVDDQLVAGADVPRRWRRWRAAAVRSGAEVSAAHLTALAARITGTGASRG